MTIPDEAVQAACARLNERGKGNNVTIPDVIELLTAALPFLTGVTSPRAQALEEAARIAEQYDQTETLTAPKEIAFAIRGLAGNERTGQETGFRDGLEAAAHFHEREAEYYSTCNGALDGVSFKLVAHFHRLHAAAIRALSQPVADGWLPIETAPKDGTMLQLLVKPGEGESDPFTTFEDSHEPYTTIGFNALSDTLEYVWQFAGWCWQHDCFIDGHGTVISWRPLPASPGASE